MSEHLYLKVSRERNSIALLLFFPLELNDSMYKKVLISFIWYKENKIHQGGVKQQLAIKNSILQQVLWQIETKYPKYNGPKLYLFHQIPPCKGGNIHCLNKRKKMQIRFLKFHNGILTLTLANLAHKTRSSFQSIPQNINTSHTCQILTLNS